MPNITGEGTYSGYGLVNDEGCTGAFYAGTHASNTFGNGSGGGYILTMDASRSNPIYGNSTTVSPESHDWIVCVVAFGTATNVGSVDVANVMSAVSQVQAEVSEKLDNTTVHLVETWKSSDGASWYRKYSDGWTEQGGSLTGNQPASVTVTFPIPFSDTNYSLAIAIIGRKSINGYNSGVNDMTITGFNFISHNEDELSSNGGKWYACGY